MTKQQFTDAAMVADLHREAEKLRTGKSEEWTDFTLFSAEKLASVLDGYANAIEVGDCVDGEWTAEGLLGPEGKTREELEAEIAVCDRMLDFFQRNGVDPD
jgi:hypothetical protein